ncbi:hypothetical protein GQ53DRAFT_696245 [Thozetella sp. PMI_491]|nr:hypothetical protein GQ53DRAFT_696245 [Thozetella sp. PMI_491]
MWLSVAQRPLRAHEVWVALQVADSRDMEHIERLLTDPAYADDQKAAASLENLLHRLVALTPDVEDPRRVVAALCDAELQTFLHHLGAEDGSDMLRSLAFSSAQAHAMAASVAMVICSVTALRLAHVHDRNSASGLVLYAWNHWSAHLAVSGISLAHESAAGLVESMIYGVCIDILAFLLSLNDFITGPIDFPATDNRPEWAVRVKHIQDILERPLVLLSSVTKYEGYASSLQSARQTFDAWKYSGGPSPAPGKTESGSVPFLENTGLLVPLRAAESKVETLRIDKVLRDAEPALGRGDRQLVRAFAEISRSLRCLAVALAPAPIYDQLLNQHTAPWSPLDVLVNAANWMEAVASYPFWNEMPQESAYDPLLITDTNDANYEAAALVLGRLQSGLGRPKKSTPRLPASRSFQFHAGLSRPRWLVASFLDKVKAPRGQTTFTINDLRLLRQRTSSFQSFPAEMQAGGDSLRFLYRLVPNSLRRLYHRRVAPFFASGFFQSIDEFSSGLFTGGVAQNWPLLKSAILADGYRTAGVYFGIAVLLHQIRRMLLPWLCAYMWYSPLEDLRVALSNPDFFLEEALSFSWTWALFMYGQKLVCDVAGGLAMGLLILNNGRVPAETIETLRDSPSLIPYFERFMEVCKVGYIAWAFATIEYVLARAINTYSFGIAYWKLLSGGDVEHLALGNILKENWTKLPLNAWQMFYYLRSAVWPLLWSSVLCAVLGQPGLLAIVLTTVGGVWAILKYRSKVFIALEVSGFFIALGLAALSGILLLVEFVDDPVGLKASTTRMRKRGNKARKDLPPGANARTQILSRRPAPPVMRPLSAAVMAEKQSSVDQLPIDTSSGVVQRTKEE